MDNQELIKEVTARAQVWLGDAYDAETRAEVISFTEIKRVKIYL